MQDFQVGDIVRRIEDPVGFGADRGCPVGAEAVVEEVPSNSTGLRLRGFGHGHSRASFELVSRPGAPKVDGRKDDGGKLDMNLLDDMPRALKAVVEVMEWAITEKLPVPYERGGQLSVHPDRYRAAIKRHERDAAEQATDLLPARMQRDAESGLLHLAHTACSAMMALENTLREMDSGV